MLSEPQSKHVPRENLTKRTETQPKIWIGRTGGLKTGHIYFRENVSGGLVVATRARPFSSKDSRAYDASRGFQRVPESARRILIMRAKL